MLGSVFGFVAKVAMWSFLIGAAVGIYLMVHYGVDLHVMGGDGASCVAPAPAAGPSG